MPMLTISLIIAFIALSYASFLAYSLKKKDQGNEKVREISKAIRGGAMSFLKKEYRFLAIFVAIVFILMGFFLSWSSAAVFAAGATLSVLAGNIGMRIATASNGRTVWAVKNNIKEGLDVAFNAGSVMGLSVVGFGILGIAVSYLIFGDPQIIFSFGFGASAVAIFARVGGGIYTKAADVGADLVGKIEAGIPEDDPRNPATIADNVGDNVGDVAGMGADLFESYVDSIIAAMVLGTVSVGVFGLGAGLLPLGLAALGCLASIAGNLIVRFVKKGSPSNILNFGIVGASLIMAVGSYFLIRYSLDNYWGVFASVLTGLVAGVAIGFITEYYTSAKFKPTRELAESSETGAATNIISGLALGMNSTIWPVLIVCFSIFLSYRLAGVYGIALTAVGMLSTLGITLATDSYGPVADNAAGIAEMAGLGQEVRERAEELDAVGNTTAAIGKGFAIGSAALTAVVLLISYAKVAGVAVVDLLNPLVIIGVFLGALLPFVFSSLAMRAVGKAAYAVVNEVRRQFREIAGLMEGKAKADYERCVEIVTTSALKQMIAPGLIAVIAPLAVGFLFGKEALAGLLVGSITSGFLLAIMMANSGGAWDNAKKYIETGELGGKGSETHKAAVVGDTVGDPFKDTAGPSLNILIKLVSIISIIIAPLL